MRSKYLLAGAGVAAVLSIIGLVGSLLELWWLVVLAGMALLSATLLVALDADRRVRSLRPYIRGEVVRSSRAPKAPKPAATQSPAVSEVDIVGAVKVLQAQYVGRMDRLQTSLDEAVALVRDERAATPPRSDQQA
ncbi:hypothetical protein [Ornithinicoccus hortensis]|uniref:Uncharacterized protein n=1 Tax=Ornithinicoccus hortensis TaxID=82346 RepID=A0A542YN90_9MICO|nr:hypothetical protein [Ornithinicoccus hortensis]TQL49404.1 hypothetical protein FB467_0474 [Ornithinicoccus hortensis]